MQHGFPTQAHFGYTMFHTSQCHSRVQQGLLVSGNDVSTGIEEWSATMLFNASYETSLLDPTPEAALMWNASRSDETCVSRLLCFVDYV